MEINELNKDNDLINISISGKNTHNAINLGRKSDNLNQNFLVMI